MLHQLVLLAAGLRLLLGQLAHLLLDVAELSLQPLVLLLLPVLGSRALIPLLCQLLHVLLQPCGQALRNDGRGVTPDPPMDPSPCSNATKGSREDGSHPHEFTQGDGG